MSQPVLPDTLRKKYHIFKENEMQFYLQIKTKARIIEMHKDQSI